MKPLHTHFALPALLILSALLASCNGKTDDKGSNESITTEAPDLMVQVDTIIIHPATFAANVISNGRVAAARHADLFFRSADPVSEVLVRNGQRVRKGQPLARLDLFRLNAEKVKNEAALQQARLEMQDVLIGQGFDPSRISEVPDDVLRLAHVRSGLLQAETLLNSTLKDIEQATISAPFDGVVANVKTSPFSMASTSEPFCRIIDNSSMTVEFPVLESEGASMKTGEPVKASSFSSGDEFTGHIVEINPLVDENGHIAVKARLDKAASLLDGMNMRVSINRPAGERLMVPKSAVVLRSGRQVVFTFKDGKALWNYVTTGLENLDSYEITDGLNPGDAVIVSGCENLAHEAPVKIIHNSL